MKALLLNHVRLFAKSPSVEDKSRWDGWSVIATLWTITRQASLSMGFSRQEYWSGLPIPSPRYLSDPGIEPASPALAGEFSTTEPLVYLT